MYVFCPTVTPNVTSIDQHSPFIERASTGRSFRVPAGYIGMLLTCNVLGWPPPIVEWTKEGVSLEGGLTVFSQSVKLSPKLGTISADLTWIASFDAADVGTYVCTIRSSEESNEDDLDGGVDNGVNPALRQSVTITLMLGSRLNIGECSVTTTEVFFHIRMLETKCSLWEGEREIAEMLQEVIVSGLAERCARCDVTTLSIMDAPTCSSSKRFVEAGTASLFRGQVVTLTPEDDDTTEIEELFCELREWLLYGPTLTINGTRYSVDPECNVRVGSATSSECTPDNTVTLAVGVSVGVSIAVAVLLCLVVVVPSMLILYV